MSLSARSKKILVVAMADKKAANEVSDAIDSGANKVAATVAALGVLTPAIDQSTTNANIAAIQAKVDAILASLKAAGLMS